MRLKKLLQFSLCIGMAASMAVSTPLSALAETNGSGYTSQVDDNEDTSYYTIPTTAVPGNLPDGTYTVPFHLFHADNNQGESTAYGNPVTGQLSMGDQTFLGYSFGKKNVANVTVKDGKVYVTLSWAESIGCYRFNWFDSKEDYLTRRNSNFTANTNKGGLPEDSAIVSDDSNGIRTAENADGASYLYIPNSYNSYGNCSVNAIKEMTFPLTSDNPVVWVELNAAGMFNATQVAYLGFYWDEYQVVSIDEDQSSYKINMADSENGTISVNGEITGDSAKAGTTLTIQANPADGYELSGISVKTADAEVQTALQSDGSYTFVMPKGDITISGVFAAKKTDDKENPGQPEITGELEKKFYALKDYVLGMDSSEYFLKDSLWLDSSGGVSVQEVNELYTEMRQWLIDEERVLRKNNYTIPDEEKESFESKLLEYDAALADQKLFGKIYPSTSSDSKIQRGHTYEVPVTLFMAEEDGMETASPLGNTVKTVKKTDTEHSTLKESGITTATVTVSYDSKYNTDEYVVQIDYAQTYTDEGNVKRSLSKNSKNSNIEVGRSGNIMTISMLTSYKDVYLLYKHQTASKKNSKGNWISFKTDQEDSVVLSIDWDNAKDVTEGTVSVDKSVLQGYVSSMTNRVKYDSIGSDRIAAYSKQTTQNLIDSGLVEKAQKILDDETATQAQVTAMETEIEAAYSSNKTLSQMLKDYSIIAAEKNKSDYTEKSWNNYKTWVDLNDEFTQNGTGVYGTPGGDFGATEETSWSKEEREIYDLRDSSGKPFSTDPADGDSVLMTYLSDCLMQGQYGKYLSQIADKYDSMEAALVSVKELREEIDALNEKYGLENDGTYTVNSYEAFTKAVAAAQTTLADADATKDAVSEARSKLADAAENLVSLKDLQDAIEAAASYENSEEKYTGTSYAAYEGALQNARKTAENGASTREEVSDAAEALNQAVSELHERADKTALAAAISDAQKTYGSENDGTYSADSYKVLTDAIAAAQTIMENTDATDEEVEKAKTGISTAAENLVSLKDLQDAIASAESYENSEEEYTTTTFAAYKKELENARTAVKNASITKEEVSASAEALNKTVAALVKRADKTALKAAIDEASEIAKQTDVYTEASMSIYQALLDSALDMYNNRPNISQVQVDEMTSSLIAGKDNLVKISSEKLDVNKLADGTYTVAVNLWHATQDKESMGNSALYHTATLTVKDGKYTLRVEGHSMTMSGQTGALDAFRLVTDGSEAKGDGSNYTEIKIQQNGDTYFVDIPLQDTADGNKVADYYYGGIKVHTVSEDGTLGYPMGTNWTPNRLRVSWDTLRVLDVENYPAFSATDAATGITVTTPEGALPAGTKMEVTKVTDSDSLSKIGTALTSLAERNTPYKIILYVEDENGNRTTVEPQNDMELTISLPVTEGYDTSKLSVYYIDADGNASEVKGTLNGSTYTIVTGKVGTYAVAEKKTKNITYNITGKKTNTSGTAANTTLTSKDAATGTGAAASTTGTTPTLTGKSSAVKTGDESNAAMSMFFAAAGASAAALLAVFRRKKER